MSEMTEAESFERFCESLKKAASRARELCAASGNPNWLQVAKGLDQARANGIKLHYSKSMSRAEALRMLDERNEQAALH